jgi:4-amino-4-deoxy-L-arabinose transferase-like glycosyltransferase
VDGRDNARPERGATKSRATGSPDDTGARRTHRRELLAVGALVLFALVLRLPTAGVQSFWLDEVYSARIVDGSLGHAWSTIQRTENTPPLFYLLDWLWTRGFGVSEFGLRSLSAVAGALAVVPMVRLARRIGGPGDGRLAPFAVGLIAAALVAVNPLAQWLSQEARAYALLILLGAAAWAALVAALDRPSARNLWVWALAAAAATWTHYFGGLLLAVGWGALALLALRGSIAGFGGHAAGGSGDPATGDRSRDVGADHDTRDRSAGDGPRGLAALRPLLAPFAASTLASAVLLPIAKAQQSTAMYEAISVVKGLASRVAETPKQFAVGYNGPAEYVLGAAIALVALACVAAAAWPRNGRATRASFVLALVVAIWVLPLLGLLGGFDVVLTRNYVVLLPPVAALVALGAWRIGRPALIAVGAVGVVQLATIVAVAVTPVYQRDDWRGAIEAAAGPGPQLLLVSHYQKPAATWYSPTLVEPPPSQEQTIRTLALIDRADEAGEPGPPAVPAPPIPNMDPRLKLVRVKRTDQYRVFVWSSPTPVPFGPALALGALDRNDRSTVLRP